jgi:hypothetical protein
MRLLNGPAPLGHVNCIVAARVHSVGNTVIDTQERLLPLLRGRLRTVPLERLGQNAPGR